jgi:polysaccharide export outer membrane protein
MIHNLSQGRSMPTFRRWFPSLIGGVAIGCASGGGGSPDVAAPPAMRDSVRVATINERIQSAAAVSTAGGDSSPEPRLGPEDQIQVDVFGAESFSGAHRIDANGEIAIPLLGPVTAGGMTPRELETHLEQRLGETYMRDPHVSVQIEEIRSRGVSVMGPVGAPGVYQVSATTSLLEVLALAQGLTEEAGSRVSVVRSARASGPAGAAAPQLLEVNLTSLLDGGDATENIRVLPGDIVQVHAAGYVYVVGQVNRPGGFTIPPAERMTVLQALAMAEGLGRTAAASRSVIVREHVDGTREEIPVNLDDVLDGGDEPPVLRPRDVLFVPNNDTKSFTLGAVDAVVRMVTLRGLFY